MSGTLDLFAAAEAERQTRPPGEGGEEPARTAYSVSALNRLVREFLDGSLPPLWVAGEIANWKRSSRGHCYFSLRDREAQVRCVLFQSDARRLPTEPEEGMRVRCFGAVTLYEARGEFQLVVREVEARDTGGLWRLAFERLRGKLEAEGVLAPDRKRPLPASPARVGIVTSPVGAALHDVLRVLEHRAPWTTAVLSPARVQGEGAEAEIAAALDRLVRHGNVDVIIVGRGGGSVEDLWAFNREEVARAILRCPVPVVSAVGHEVDVTIADLVADHRAATPSAAAERVVLDGVDVRRRLTGSRVRMAASLRRALETRRRDAGYMRDALVSCLVDRLGRGGTRLGRAADRLQALSPLAALKRGYAVAQDPEGRVLRRAESFRPGSRFRLRVADGRVDCLVEGVEADGEA
ncbi:MAG TPA: exodeoxyribonuclease VII large subunit [Longimicrobiales bacterium]|nr:exodeoxyribonuclease VII large subunit [Longimicrobiales bacterium]